MHKLAKKIEELKKNRGFKDLVDKRISEFELVGKADRKRIFSELCFCILTANSSAERCIIVQEKENEHFHELEEKQLVKRLKNSGCRFHTKRANYIVDARKKRKELFEIIEKFSNDPINEHLIREWVADNIKGLGMKESSHFLRNIGYKNFAIIDFHILDLLIEHGFLKYRPKTMNKPTYLEIEKVLETLCKQASLSQAELDLYLWYMETGKVLK